MNLNPFLGYVAGQEPTLILVRINAPYLLDCQHWLINIFIGEKSYGHLAFTTNEKKLALSEQIISNDFEASDLDFTRLRKYLKDQFNQIGPCVDAVRCWTYRYNGSNPPIKEAVSMIYNSSLLEEPISDTGASSQMLNPPEKQADQKASSTSSQYPLVDPADIYMYCMEQLTTCLSEMKSNSASPGQSSGYYSINCNLQPNDLLKEEATFFSKEVQDDLEFWSLMRDDDSDSTPIVTPVCI